MKILLLSIVAIIFFHGIYAQTGSTCEEPKVIESLPFNFSSHTASSGNNFDNICGSMYSSGNDYVIEYTPTIDESINVTLSNTAPVFIGLFITEGCPAEANCIAENEANSGNPSILNVSLLAGVTYYIMVSSNVFFGVGIETTSFTINVKNAYSNDLSISSVADVESGCNINADTLIVTVNNVGIDDVSSYNITYSVNGGDAITETVSTILPSGDSKTTALDNLVDFPTINRYDILVSVELEGDEDSSNDEYTLHAVNSPVVDSYVYYQDFENIENMWWFANGENSTLELGTPNAPIINSASSGTNAWVTNLTGNCNSSENSYLQTPCFDFSNIGNPAIEFDLWWEGGSLASLIFYFSTDGGATWNPLEEGEISENWVNPRDDLNTAGWINVKNVNIGLAGLSNIRFKFSIAGGVFMDDAEGMAIDNFSIYDYNSMGSIIEIENSFFSLFPNPATSFVDIRCTEKGYFSIIDINGKTLIEQYINYDTRIDISELKSGMYIVKYISENKIGIQKLMKR